MEKNVQLDGKHVKPIAFYLPQFHVFKENNEWWGEGFTEWTNVKKATPLFKGHDQPRKPLNDNYYDLSDIETIINQWRLAKEYNLYGFCYYHYWFDGKKLLHKPLEMMRDYQGEKINYLLCWANEPWTRAWDGNNSEVLMPQKYGNEKDWKAHFDYLLSFFKDEYYIKIDNRPALVIYRCNNIPNCDEMVDCWDKLCRDYGFDGLYLIEEINAFQNKACCSGSEAVLSFEPTYTFNFGRNTAERVRDKLISESFNLFTGNHLVINTYDRIWKRLLKNTRKTLSSLKYSCKEKKYYPGAFVGWDNTPRKGKKGRVVLHMTPDKFKRYLKELEDIARKGKCDYIFINAWNEWGEGAFLEPDSENGYATLESIRDIFNQD